MYSKFVNYLESESEDITYQGLADELIKSQSDLVYFHQQGKK